MFQFGLKLSPQIPFFLENVQKQRIGHPFARHVLHRNPPVQPNDHYICTLTHASSVRNSASIFSIFSAKSWTIESSTTTANAVEKTIVQNMKCKKPDILVFLKQPEWNGQCVSCWWALCKKCENYTPGKWWENTTGVTCWRELCQYKKHSFANNVFWCRPCSKMATWYELCLVVFPFFKREPVKKYHLLGNVFQCNQHKISGNVWISTALYSFPSFVGFHFKTFNTTCQNILQGWWELSPR